MIHYFSTLLADPRNLAGLIASLGCTLVSGVLLVMIADWDRPRDQRGWEQAESVRGLFNDRTDK